MQGISNTTEKPDLVLAVIRGKFEEIGWNFHGRILQGLYLLCDHFTVCEILNAPRHPDFRCHGADILYALAIKLIPPVLNGSRELLSAIFSSQLHQLSVHWRQLGLFHLLLYLRCCSGNHCVPNRFLAVILLHDPRSWQRMYPSRMDLTKLSWLQWRLRATQVVE